MPPLDPELGAFLASLPALPSLSAETLAAIRPYSSSPVEPLLASGGICRREETIIREGAELALSVFAPEDRSGPLPGILWLHGGGMVMGDRFSQIDIPVEWLEQLGAVVVTIDYRLAPEATGRTLVDDAYAGLAWLAEHADELGVDPARLVVAGASAGGGLAAGVALLARDRGAPALAAQVLIGPMLDHRAATPSALGFSGPGTWSRESNRFAWTAVLPPAFVDAGSAELFRDEDIAYAAGIWAAGGEAELHVWTGGFHGFDALVPDAAVSRAARAARIEWLRRVLARA
jgi:acetyl esterase/lipase